MLPKQYRLTEDAKIRLVRNRGRSWSHPLAILYSLPSELQVVRVGISASKRVGDAVARNRAKRLVREAVRKMHPQVQTGWDLLFVVRPPIATASFADVSAAVEQLLRRARLLAGAVSHSHQTGDIRSGLGPPKA